MSDMKKPSATRSIVFFLISAVLTACSSQPPSIKGDFNNLGQPVYVDKPFIQDYSIKFYLSKEQPDKQLKAISSDRNNHIRILSEKGVLVPDNGNLFFSGGLIRDLSYTPLLTKKIADIITYKNHTIYLDDKHVFSNAWAGKIQVDHQMPDARMVAAGQDFHFLVSNGSQMVYLNQAGEKLWEGSLNGINEIKYHAAKNRFIITTQAQVAELTSSGSINTLYEGSNINSAHPLGEGEKIVIGTAKGYVIYPENELISKVPWPEINCINEINGDLWFGSARGAFKLNENGQFSYYAGERWLPGNEVIAITQGPENSILVLTNKGLGQIFFEEMTLEEKAMFFEKQVREKNIRYGFNCSVSRLPNGYSTAQMGAQPSDNLWTAMYLASQLFRYKVTGSQEAKINAYESFEAMERLHTITGIEGLFARSIERDHMTINTKTEGWKERELATGSPAVIWAPGVDHSNWAFRSTASSDQAVGQMFALTMILELADDEEWKKRALELLDNMMSYIVDNDLYIIDIDGEPTLWGKWNPDYVNAFPTNVGDRRLYSSNFIGFLQTAYHFTGKSKYKDKAYELMNEYGYLENLTRPINEIGRALDDDLSQVLSKEWNHSDDQMYFLGYWGLYPYAFTPELKEQYFDAIHDHWIIERPEKNALWNFIYAMTGAREFDLAESIEFLQQYPLDLRNWNVQNSHRHDIEILPDNFRKQSTWHLLPLGEIPLHRHNGNIFQLDRGGMGDHIISAGDVWLLPYWMGRYLEVISAPQANY
ncbi:MAG: hypothetical protein JJU28_10965 [Cyclobacteriaceae bacterium]|nr:hypothetical protein [Cyclobacteriaceae bacterium]